MHHPGVRCLNSVWLALPAVILSSVLGSLNGYVLAKWRFRGSNVIFALILFGMFIPHQAIPIPLVQFLQSTALLQPREEAGVRPPVSMHQARTYAYTLCQWG